MSQLMEKEIVQNSPKQLDNLIKEAMKKLGLAKENQICRYLPMNSGGHIHHFTMKKMKTMAPEQLIEMISKYIIRTDKPPRVSPKKRASRGSRKHRDKYVFSSQELERLRNIARLAGDKEMISRLSPKMDHRIIKRDLISSIKKGKVDQDLWSSYVESTMAQQQAVAPNLGT